MPRYLHRPVIIDAIESTGTSASNQRIVEWTRGSQTPAVVDEHPMRGECLTIATLEGIVFVAPGDYVLRGISGEHYPCKPDIFHATYELAE